MTGKKKLVTVCAALIIFGVMLFFASKVQNIYVRNAANSKTNRTAATDNNGNSPDTLKDNESTSAHDISKKTENNAKSSDTSNSTKTSLAADSSGNVDNSKGKIDNSTKPSTNHSSDTAALNGKKTDDKASSKAQSVPSVSTQEEPTLTIIDAVHNNKIILKKHIEKDGETVGSATCRLLDESHISYKIKGTADTLYFSAIDGIEEKKEGQLSGWCYYVKENGSSDFLKSNVGSGQYKLKKGDSVIWKYLKDALNN